MRFTDIFIKRPVLASVVSLLILLFGLRAIVQMPVRQFPKMENTVITVTTAYPGASASLIQGFITTPLQQSIAGADGIDYITADSNQSISTIKAHIKLNFSPNQAFTNIMSKVAQVEGQLPRSAEKPIIAKAGENQSALLYMSFNSKQMSSEQITDYVTRVIQPQLQTIAGVASANVLGGSTFAMRIWLNPDKMAALNLSALDITNALREKNFQTAAGKTKGELVAVNVRATTDLHNAQQFKNIIIKSDANGIMRLGDVANVELGSEDYDSSVTFNGKQAVFVGITATPSANPLTVIKSVRNHYPAITKKFPPTLQSAIVYDATTYIRASLSEVIQTLVEATLIVLVVIFLFLGDLRSVLIPIVTIPLSLIGVCALMLGLGYSINLLTLLAMVLAIGLVVDDAIVVIENIHRHIEEGLTPFDAALKGAREIALPVIAMTLTLAAVYAPIGFMGGLTGALFKEFAFTLAGSVIISGIIALTLSPMMSSKLLKKNKVKSKFSGGIDNFFNGVKLFYTRRLTNVLQYRPVMLVMAASVLVSLFFLYQSTPKETAPQEDSGFYLVIAKAPQYANIDYLTKYTKQLNPIFNSFKQVANTFIINGMGGPNSAFAGMVLKPWSMRGPQKAMGQSLNKKLGQVAGLQTMAVQPPSLPGGGDGAPINFVLTTTMDYKLLFPVADKLAQAAQQSGMFIFAINTLKFDNPEFQVNINREKAAQMGVSMEAIGNALSTALSGGYTNRFSMDGRSYKVIPQLIRRYRMNPNQLQHIYVKTRNGQMVSLATVVNITSATQPNVLSQFQQMNSATIEGMARPGVTMGDALHFLTTTADKIMPKGMSYNYAGQSRQFIQENNALLIAFIFSIIIIFLVLAAQFESWRDPLIILVSVPMSICGALLPLNWGLASINIYTQIGLITLIGLISKHGILMVDFANHLQVEKGLNKFDAIIEAASIRLRPILMTTAAMIFGVMPLLIARGAGAASRFDIGLVISSGMFIGTLFTLFIVPTMYTYLGEDKLRQPKAAKQPTTA